MTFIVNVFSTQAFARKVCSISGYINQRECVIWSAHIIHYTLYIIHMYMTSLKYQYILSRFLRNYSVLMLDFSKLTIFMKGNSLIMLTWTSYLQYIIIAESKWENYCLVNLYNVGTNCLYKIFISLCMSLDVWQLWDVSHRYNNKLYVSWRKAIRIMFNLPYRTNSSLLHLMINDLPVDGQIQLCIIKFFNCMYANKNNVMVYVADWQQTVVIRLYLTVEFGML